MRAVALLLALLALTSCGADGPPTAPNGTRPNAAITLSGSAEYGISGNF